MQSRRLAAAGGGDEGLGRRVDDAGTAFLVLSRNQADVLQTVSAKIKRGRARAAQGAHGRLRNPTMASPVRLAVRWAVARARRVTAAWYAACW